MTRVHPPISSQNGLNGAFQSLFSKYSIWDVNGRRQALSASEGMFLLSLCSDLDHAATLLPDLSKELTFLKELINDEL